MNLQLPQEIAMQKKMQAMQQNQLYTLAFQIYCSFLGSSGVDVDIAGMAKCSIEAAKVFNAAVAADSKMKEVK